MLALGEDCGPEVIDLTRLCGVAASTVRTRFAALGERWELEMQARLGTSAAATRLKVLESARQTLEAELAQLRNEAVQAAESARLREEAAITPGWPRPRVRSGSGAKPPSKRQRCERRKIVTPHKLPP